MDLSSSLRARWLDASGSVQKAELGLEARAMGPDRRFIWFAFNRLVR